MLVRYFSCRHRRWAPKGSVIAITAACARRSKKSAFAIHIATDAPFRFWMAPPGDR
jgi:hypothetical protein